MVNKEQKQSLSEDNKRKRVITIILIAVTLSILMPISILTKTKDASIDVTKEDTEDLFKKEANSLIEKAASIPKDSEPLEEHKEPHVSSEVSVTPKSEVTIKPEELVIQKLNNGEARVHYIGLKDKTDAILLESKGRFAMIDSGDDWDYPDGSDPRYPHRLNIWTDRGWDMQVIHYLESVGVNSSNFDLYIGTHSHADHIGLADDIILRYKPKDVYLKYYDDSNMANQSPILLADNQYVYDQMVAAINAVGSKRIQDIPEGSETTLGDIKLQFYNTALQKSENENSLVIRAYINDTVTIFAGDATKNILGGLYRQGVFENVDIVKMAHHGIADGFSKEVITGIAPKEAIFTGKFSAIKDTLDSIGTTSYSTNDESVAAWVTQYSSEGYKTTANYVKEGWWDFEGERYYIRSNGTLVASDADTSSWQEIEGGRYYFERGLGKCRMLTGWVRPFKQFFYLDPNNQGKMVRGWRTIDGAQYYFKNPEGGMQTGWLKDGTNWYYLGFDGAMQTGWVNDGQWYYFGTSGAMRTGWVHDGKGWCFLNRDNGVMQTGWVNDGQWYYLGSMGTIQSGWIQDGKNWYYLDEKGIMQTGKWIKDYYLLDSGIMATNQWIDDNYVGGDGKWIPNHES